MRTPVPLPDDSAGPANVELLPWTPHPVSQSPSIQPSSELCTHSQYTPDSGATTEGIALNQASQLPVASLHQDDDLYELRKFISQFEVPPVQTESDEYRQRPSWNRFYNALGLNDLDAIRDLIAHDPSGVNSSVSDSVGSHLPVEISIAYDNVAVTTLLISHGARTDRIRLEKLGFDVLAGKLGGIRPRPPVHENDELVARAARVWKHFDEVGLEKFDTLLRFRVGTIAGVARAVKAACRAVGLVDLKGYEGYKALSIAARFRHKDVVSVLLDAGAAVDRQSTCSDAIFPPLYWAVEHGDLDTANKMLLGGVQTGRKYCSNGVNCTEICHKDYNTLVGALPTTLQLAVLKRDRSMTTTLLCFAADVHAEPISGSLGAYSHLAGKTTLEIALTVEPRCDTELVQSLLKAGAEINIPYFDPSMGPADGKKMAMRQAYSQSGSLSFIQAAAWRWDYFTLSNSPSNANFNGVSPKGLTVFHMLFMDTEKFDHDDCLLSFELIWDLLTSRGAKVNKPGSESLISTVVIRLLSKDVHISPDGKNRLLDFLISRGLVCNEPRALEMVVARKEIWLLRKLVGIPTEQSHLEHAALVLAVKKRCRPAIEALTQRKTSATRPCNVQAFEAARSMGSRSLVNLLVSRGVPVQKAEIPNYCRPSFDKEVGERSIIWCPEYDIELSETSDSEDSDRMVV